MPEAELFSIGSELLLGQTVDTNASFLGRQLSELGFEVQRKTTLPDTLPLLTDQLREALARVPLVITTGGLGPTEDDLTRQAAAAACGRELERSAALEAEIEAFFQRFGRPMGDNNRKQADLPAGAIAISNPVGTAPAFAVEQGASLLVCLPGVPREMKHLFDLAVRPLLVARGGGGGLAIRVLRTAGVGESRLDALLEGLPLPPGVTLGTMAHVGAVDVRLLARAPDQAAAEALLEAPLAEARARLGAAVYGCDERSLPQVVLDALSERGWTLASVEDASAGWLAGALAGAGREGFLGGAVARPCEASPLQLAEQTRDQLGADVGLALIASEGGVEIACAFPPQGPAALRQREERALEGEVVRRWVASLALMALLEALRG